MNSPHQTKLSEMPFVNEMRLNGRHWIIVGMAALLVILLTPPLWERLERFDTGADFRLPYSLSKDYWLYRRYLRQSSDTHTIVVLGDSVIWGEYVLPDGTLSHFLNQEAGESERFLNAGVNGLFPLALEGLVRHYGGDLRHRKVILHCNVLWMSSPKADLQADKEEKFNHARLVPQFRPRIPCYRADANERLSAVVERNVDFMAWVNHLQNAYFGQKSILEWTLQDDGGDPPRYPNSYRNPLGQITLTVPAAQPHDSTRGPGADRHRPWTDTAGGTTHFDWVTLDSSIQWSAFRRLVTLLRSRDNDVLVVLGPFNEQMVAPEDRAVLQSLNSGITAWLAANQVRFVVPKALPTALYADASHPLTAGYALLAKDIFASPAFQRWLPRATP